MPKFYLSINATARVCAEDHFSAPSLADAIAKVKADGLAAFNFTLDDDQDDGRNLDGPATAYLFDDENGAGWENDPLAEIPLGDSDPPATRAVIADALAFKAEAFEGDEEVNGGDLVEWFSGWRETAKAAIAGTPSTAPADPVKAEMLAALKAAMDDGFLAGEVLDQVAAAIARAEGRA